MNLCDELTIRMLLERHGFHFSKSMGQNFLIDPQIPADIAAASRADETCGVLEIGPGIGPLTSELAQRAGKVVSIELDRALELLLERLEEAGVVHKVNTESGAFYLYCSHGEGRRDCFLLKCQRCGRIRHLDCDHLKDLYEHLETAHHFRIDPRRTLFTGLCEECAREEDTHGNQ